MRTLLICALMVFAGASAHAGVVEVRFAAPEGYTDAGRGAEAAADRDVIARQLQALGAKWLPAQQTLRITITDIDLAGELRPISRAPFELRVLRGRADWPRIALHYSLGEQGRELASGDAEVQDMDYLSHADFITDSQPLPYERRMLTAWFFDRFVADPR